MLLSAIRSSWSGFGGPGVIWSSPFMVEICCVSGLQLFAQVRCWIKKTHQLRMTFRLCLRHFQRIPHFLFRIPRHEPNYILKFGSVMEQSTPDRKTWLAYLFVRLMLIILWKRQWFHLIPKQNIVKLPNLLGNYCAERKRVKVVVHKQGPSVFLPGDSMSSVCSCCNCVSRRHM